MATGRNEPCPCGSGKKAKNCCGVRRQSFLSEHGPTMIVAIVLAIGASAIIAALKTDDAAPKPTAPQLAQAAIPASGPAQSSPAPAQTALTPPAATRPAPPGPAPAGKVWSAQHGHWHDAPLSPPIKIDVAGGTAPAPVTTSPTGELPPMPGMIWSEEHKHWHSPETNSNVGNVRVFPRGAPPERPAPTPKPQPPGPVPEGMEWSAEHGHWHKKKG